MRIIVLGGDGYLGWPISMYLARKGHDVLILDSCIKSQWELQLGIHPLAPTKTIRERIYIFKETTGLSIYLKIGYIQNHRFLYRAFDEFQPEAIVNCANQSSSVYSMMNRNTAIETMENNVIANMNLLFAIQHSRCDPHFIIIGNSDADNIIDSNYSKNIEKGDVENIVNSFCDLSHIYQFLNTYYVSNIWGMHVTVLNLGIVYGMSTAETEIAEELETRFYYDGVFGTVANRFCTQAIGEVPLTVYGSGKQKRSFIILEDAVKCLEKVIFLSPEVGKVNILRGVADTLSINELAKFIQDNAREYDRKTEIIHVENPRIELRSGNNNLVDSSKDFDIDMVSIKNGSLKKVMDKIIEYKDNLKPDSLKPSKVYWQLDAWVKKRDRKKNTGFIDEHDSKINIYHKRKEARRKICFSTGKRGGFGALNPLLKMISEDDSTELQLIVTDMHLYETFGKTANEVAKYFEISRVVDMAQNKDTHWARTRSLGRCMIGMAQVMHDLSPDIILLLGDRSETLATAFSAVEMGIPVAHVQAGDVSGGLDDLHRHSITKLAHLHFSQTEKQGQRVLALGEEPWRVSVVGAPYVDRILANEYTKDPELFSNKYGLDVEKPFVLILQHSDTYHPDESYSQMVSILEAVSKTDFPAIVSYPCSDQGYQGVIDAISEVRGNSQFKIFNSIDSFDFLGLQSFSELFIGNSSAGVIEAPYFALPFVNVGSRQDRREKDINVIEAGTTVDSIMSAMEKGLNSKFRNNLRNALPVFGDGTANKKIYEILKKVKLGKKLFHKRVIVERK